MTTEIGNPVEPEAPRLALSPEMPRPKGEERTTLLDARAMSRALQRMAVEILELAHRTDLLLFVGIQRRRVELGTSLSKLGQLTQSAVGRVVRGDVVVRRSAVRRRATTPPSVRWELEYGSRSP